MTFVLGANSLRHLQGVHPDLIKVVNEMLVVSDQDFTIICGLRSLAEQEHLVAIGASMTMRSRHLTGHAVDWCPLINGKVTWDDKEYIRLVPLWKKAGENVGIPVESGADWVTFKDYDHIQLPWAKYPAIGSA